MLQRWADCWNFAGSNAVKFESITVAHPDGDSTYFATVDKDVSNKEDFYTSVPSHIHHMLTLAHFLTLIPTHSRSHFSLLSSLSSSQTIMMKSNELKT